MSKWYVRFEGWAVVVIALAALLRLAHLDQVPSCLEYDEGANVILAGEIARGQSLPVFIRPYTGKEVLYFYLAAAVMKLAGVTPFALRLASVAAGIAGIALTFFLVRELAAVGGHRKGTLGQWLPLFSAALVAVSYWQVHLSRFGYRAIVLPPLLALTVGLWLRGLRSGRWQPVLLSGAAAGLSAYTYSSVRVFPILLLLLWAWALIADRRRWRLRLAHLALFGLAAGAVFAPLGVFFLRNPEAFSVRMAQVSVLSPAAIKGDLWGTLRQTLRLSLGMFAIAGDMNPLYNSPGKPVFDRLLSPFFYLGLAICLQRLLRRPSLLLGSAPFAPGLPSSRERIFPHLPYFVLLAWLVVMMMPNVLSTSGVPHNLRAMALVPAVFVIAALGILLPARWLGSLVTRTGHWPGARGVLLSLVLLSLLGFEGARTYHDYFDVWAGSAGPYYRGNEALLHAAALIDAHPEADPYVATYFHQHATLAVASRRYEQIRWLSGQTLILPPPGAPPALLIYDHTNPIDPLLRDRYLPADALLHRELGPDGKVGFEAYLVSTGQSDAAADDTLAPAPQFPMQANLGHTLLFLGYDLNGPALSGGTLDVTLYLRVLRQVDRNDYAFFAHLVDDLGFHWGADTFFEYPSAQWRPGEVLIMRRQLDIAPGAPPGTYALDVGAFSASLDARLPLLNDAGQMVGTVVQAAPIPIERAAGWPEEMPPIQQPVTLQVDDTLTFLGSDRDRSDLRPGETLALTLYWQAREAVKQDYAVVVWLSGAAGDVRLWEGAPVHGRYLFTQWTAGDLVRDRYALRLPIDAQAGDFDLRVALHDEQGAVVDAGGAAWISLGTIHVHASDRTWEPPPFMHPVGALLGEQVELLGYDLDREQARPGETLHLTLIWRCREAMDVPYTVFTHLLDPGEQVRGQKDNPPVHGTYPTTLWVPGEVVVDRYEIPVAAGAAPGVYVIEVGMYDPATLQRLPVHDPTGAIGDGHGSSDRILLASVQVQEDQ